MFVRADWQTGCGIDLGLEVSILCPIEGAATVIFDENKSVIVIISIIFHQTCDILGDKMKHWFMSVTMQRPFTLNPAQPEFQ